MATYAIGDVQGCFAELSALLTHIAFEPTHDKLWFSGDLVNRGPQSLAVLRFIKSLPESPVVVLGNHDLHLLALAYGVGENKKQDTLQEILQADDCQELCEWLRHQPLIHHDATLNFTMVHAGLSPQWDLSQALACAQELEAVLRGKNFLDFFRNMYGNEPTHWRDNLAGWDRLRYIVNSCTRMRFCDIQGDLELTIKGSVGSQPEGYIPWFKTPHRVNKDLRIVFGHWASLNGHTGEPNVHALDTGCAWGNCLTAMRLEDGQRFSVSCTPL